MTQHHLNAPDVAPRLPGPPSPWFGAAHMQAISKDFLGYTRQMHREYGDIVFVQMYWEKVCLLNSPELVRAVMVDNAASLIRQERAIEVFSRVHGPSVMMVEGDDWQRLHRLLMPAFSPRRVAGYARLMVDAAGPLLDRLVPDEPDASALVNMDELTSRVTMDVICRTLFSDDLGDTARAVTAASHALNEIAMRELMVPMTLPDNWPLPGKAAKRHAMRLFDEVIDSHIAARRQMPPDQAPQDDVLAMLLAAHDEEGGGRLSEAELRAQCKVIFLAGFDTSAKALQWWAWLMAEHPQQAALAYEEVSRVVGSRAPQAEDVPNLPYLSATIKETLRLYPPAAGLLTRRAMKDIQAGEWMIPARSLVIVSPWVLHNDARSFPQPDVFRPERFMPDAPALPRSAWMPFGLGPRVCIGQHFAMTEMTLVAAMLLQRYELTREPGQPEPVAQLNLTLRPAQTLKLRMRRRSSMA
ncbi:MAG: cytochrome P450 [Aquabacterium sp.]|uniref:cytochrome P450 n=1 Tax=Aquabacterium sp. TaxID=1872578 RepID=UPI001201F922|nr:cytochrome P450 [Aquabacterium sp.]TAK85313.1 MAG: cytochrome P450 [Aquabacterium sp.]